jgi:uncharacterized delta-60 repeat protein
MKNLLSYIIFLAFITPGIGQKITIDSSFGENGVKFLEDIQNVNFIIKDNKHRLLALQNNFNDSIFILNRYLENGEIDETFGLSGKVVVSVKSEYDRASFIRIQCQQDDKILMLELENAIDLGCQYVYKGPITLKRLLENGDIDTTYGNSGFVKIELDSNLISTANITVQKDSSTLVYRDFFSCQGFWPPPPPSFNSYLYKIDTDGQIDSVFGDNGVVKLELLGFLNYCEVSTTISQDNKIILGSCYYDQDNNTINILTRLNQNGDIDTLFGENGIVLLENGFYPFQMSVGPANSIYTYDYDGFRSCILKISQNGNIDTSFTDQGKICISSSTYVINPVIIDFDFYDENQLIIGSFYKDSYLKNHKLFIYFADNDKNLDESIKNKDLFIWNDDGTSEFIKIWEIDKDFITIYGEKYINNMNKPFFIRFKIDKTSNVAIEKNIENVNIIPNPTTTSFSLDLPEDFNYENAVMKVYDLYGRVVMEKKGMEILRNHDMSAQPEGIYFINLQSSKGKAVSRLIKI